MVVVVVLVVVVVAMDITWEMRRENKAQENGCEKDMCRNN